MKKVKNGTFSTQTSINQNGVLNEAYDYEELPEFEMKDTSNYSVKKFKLIPGKEQQTQIPFNSNMKLKFVFYNGESGNNVFHGYWELEKGMLK